MTQRGGLSAGGAASGSAFRELGTALAREFLDDIEQEHRREMDVLYEEQLTLRSELERTVTLMKNEIAPREKLMHQMFDTLRDAYEKSTTELHNQMQSHEQAVRQASAQGDGHRRQLFNPMEEMDSELDRIGQMLQRPLVAPNVQGWLPPTSFPPPSPSRPAGPPTGSIGAAAPDAPGSAWPTRVGGVPLGTVRLAAELAPACQAASPALGSSKTAGGGGGGSRVAGGDGSSLKGSGPGVFV